MTTVIDINSDIINGRLTGDELDNKIAEAVTFAEEQGFVEQACDDIGIPEPGLIWLMQAKAQYDHDGTKNWQANDADQTYSPEIMAEIATAVAWGKENGIIPLDKNDDGSDLTESTFQHLMFLKARHVDGTYDPNEWDDTDKLLDPNYGNDTHLLADPNRA